MAAGGLTISGGGHGHGGREHGGRDQRGHDQWGHDHRGLVDVPAKFTSEVMAWLKAYLDGLSDSPHGGHDEFGQRGDSGYVPNDGRDGSVPGSDRHQGADRNQFTSGDDRGDGNRNVYTSYADATVPAADTFGASMHFTRGAGGTLTFINHSADAATVYAGHHGAGSAVSAFGGAGNSYSVGGNGAVTLQGSATHDYLDASSSIATNVLIAGTGLETLVASSTMGANTFELGLPPTGSQHAPIADAVVSTSGSGLQTFMLGSSSSSTLTGSNAAGATNLYDFMRDSATESNGGAHYTITDFNAANSTIFITDSTTAAGSVHLDSIAKSGGGAEILLSDGSTITLKGVDPQSLVAHSSNSGGISIT
ncbi:hypothetical protein [Acidocella sp.]|jgi:hypothetical protein|uniref:hypothetical protein n=1 Tax=Acidocella sp. TaxID=50710 RepID=UPI002F4190EA